MEKDVKTAIGAARAKASRRPKSGGEKTASPRKSPGNGGGRGGKRRPGRSVPQSRSPRA